jgi:tetratricopeptide (TPR) repeat protein
MKKLFFATVLLSIASIATGQIPSLQEGIRQMQNENYAAALNTFNAIAKNDPKNGTIYYYIGQVSYLTEDFPAAEKAYKQGLTINTQCAECKVGLGKLELDKGNTSAADEYFESASRMDKKNAQIFSMIGEAYLDAKKPNGNKAVEYLATSRGMEPKNANTWARLGDAYKLVGQNGEAMTSYQTAVEKDPKNTAAYVSMAKIWKAAKQDSLAIIELKKAIELAPDDAPAYKELIELYVKNNQYAKVTPLLDKYVTLSGDDIDAKVRFVKFLTFQAKDYDRAIEDGEKLLKTNPEQYTLHRWLAWAYFEKGDCQHSYDHSQQLFDEIGKKEDRKSYPSDYDYWAKAAFCLGKLDDAAHIYRKLIELDSTPAYEIYGKLAKAYYDAKNYEQAISYYKRKGGIKPLNVTDNYYLGLAYYYLDLNIQSDSVFTKVLEVTPEHATSWLMKARIGNRLDTAEVKQFIPKEAYENYIKYGSADPERNKRNLIESYKYMAYYWIQQEEKGNVTAKGYYEKVLELDPTDQESIDNLKLLNAQR